MPWIDHARTAVLAAYKAALDEGVSGDIAVDLAISRYRAFFPTTSETEVRQALASAIASDGPGTGVDDGDEKYAHPATAELHDQVVDVDAGSARAFRMKTEDLRTVADGTGSPQARQALRDLARTYERLAERGDARARACIDAKASDVG